MSDENGGEPVLVTGARGFLASALLPHLRAQGDLVREFRGDLRDPAAVRDAVRGVRAVYHLAAVTAKWLPDRRVFADVNVRAAVALARAAAEAGAQRVVHVSSFTVFGPTPATGGSLDESAPIQPARLQNDYQRSKAEAHLALLDLAQRAGLPVVIACPGVLYGVADSRHRNPVAECVRRQLVGRLRWWPGGGHRVWTFSWLDDVASGLRRWRHSARPGEVVVLGGPDAPLRAVFAWVAANAQVAMPRGAPLWPFLGAGALIEVMARALRCRPRLTASALRLLHHDWSVRSDLAARRLGYLPTPLPQGLLAIWRDLHARRLVPQEPPSAAVPPAGGAASPATDPGERGAGGALGPLPVRRRAPGL